MRGAAPNRPSCARPSAAAALLALAGGCGFSSAADVGQGAPDAPIADGPTVEPAGTCFGANGWQVCLDAPPTGQLVLSGTLDTGAGDPAHPCLSSQPASWSASQPDACFIVADAVEVTSLTVTGKRPLVVVGRSRIAVTGLLDLAGRRGRASGAGAQSTECNAFPRNPAGGGGAGGGAGGSFLTQGGNGGTGDATNHQGGLASAPVLGAPARLRGGCAGQVGGGGKPGDAGAGGGAVYLVSGGEIAIGGTIDASGAGGAGGAAQVGGSGGGSGGMIVLHGSPITTLATALLLANGGGGGGGGASAAADTATGGGGQDPAIAVPIVPAAGGPGGVAIEGTGGSGGSGFPGAVAAITGGAGSPSAGGGGGGGGAGYLLSSHDLAPAAVSPAAAIGP